MKTTIVLLFAFASILTVGSCRRDPAGQQPATDKSLEERLSLTPYHGDDFVRQVVTSLHGRRSWPVNSVKIPLNKPTVCVYATIDGVRYSLAAWPKEQNDFGVPMARLESGGLLYELTELEYEVLNSKYARNPNVPDVGNDK